MTTSTTQATITVPVGPAGRAMAEPMSGELLDLMQAHLNLERQSAADYFAAAIWFAERELSGFAAALVGDESSHQPAARLVPQVNSAGRCLRFVWGKIAAGAIHKLERRRVES